MPKRLKTAIQSAIVFMAYLAVIISFLLPVSYYLHSRILSGEKTDVNGTLWYQWFTKQCLQKGDLASLYHTNMIAYPSGKNLLFDLGPAVIPALSIPFQLTLGSPADYNVFMVFLMALNGLACFILLKYIYKDAVAAFTAGLFCSINPYVFYQVNSGRPEQTAIFWIPLFILFLLKMKDEKSTSYGCIAAIVLTLACLSYWFYGVFLVIVTGLFLFYCLFIEKEDSAVTAKNIAVLLCLFGALMLLLFAYPILIKGVQPAGFRPSEVFPAFKAIEVPRHPMPLHQPRLPIHFLTPDYYKYMVSNTSLNLLAPVFLVWAGIILIFSLFDAIKSKHNLFYIITAGCFFLLSLGPYLSIWGLPVPLPYIALYYLIPSFSRLWWPVNCFAVVLVCVSILLAVLVCQIRLRDTLVAKFILPAVLVIAYLFPFYNARYAITQRAPWLKIQAFAFSKFERPHEIYGYLRDQPDCALLELPFSSANMDFLRNQLFHGKKVFDSPGYPIKEILWPGEHLAYLRSNELLAYLDLLFTGDQTGQTLPARDIFADHALQRAARQLYARGFKFIVVNPAYFESEKTKRRLYPKLRQIFRQPHREYPDGTLLYSLEDLTRQADK